MAHSEGLDCGRAAYAQGIRAAELSGQADEAMQIYALALQAGAFKHWKEEEPFTIDLHGFSVHAAACAVRYVLHHEIGNCLQTDLKIVTGMGKHSCRGPRVLPRVRRLLRYELDPPLPFDNDWQNVCDEHTCVQHVDSGCLVIQLQDLFSWLVKTKPYESYVLNIPPGSIVA